MFSALLVRFAGLTHWKLGCLATALLLQGAIVSPFPEEVVIITLGVLWGQGRISFLEAMFFNCLGLVPGNYLPVFLGGKFGVRILRRRPFSWMASPESVESALKYFNGRGGLIIFLARFTPFIRGPIYFAAGMARMGALWFIVVDTAAAIVQTGLIQLIGRKMGENSDSLWAVYQKIGALMAALLIGGALWGYFRKAALKRKSHVPIHPDPAAKLRL